MPPEETPMRPDRSLLRCCLGLCCLARLGAADAAPAAGAVRLDREAAVALALSRHERIAAAHAAVTAAEADCGAGLAFARPQLALAAAGGRQDGEPFNPIPILPE